MRNTTLSQLGNDILSTAQGELYLSMRFLDAALSALSFELSPLVPRTATDGETLYFQPHFLLTSYQENPVIINRAYLHSLIHCLFSHLYFPPKPNQNLWNLCCDICVESLIDSLNYSCLKRSQSPLREQTYRFLSEQASLYTPGKLYRLLDQSVYYQKNGLLLEREFTVDTHDYWPKEQTEEQEKHRENQSRWQELHDKTRTSMETFERRAGTNAGTLLQMLQAGHSERRYDTFLKRFAHFQENLKTNPEEFDLAYYTLGMNLYGNIPLVEPLEYREEKKIRELVIAVDTSGSCQGVPVKNFLSETLAILQNSDRFFERVRIHILQFDTIIQEETVITNFDDLKSSTNSFRVKGFGGTDYRCVFRYLENGQKTGLFQKLQGLLILTDGFGTFPSEPPPYPTAFLLADFLNNDSRQSAACSQIPPWGIQLRINEDELDEYSKSEQERNQKK